MHTAWHRTTLLFGTLTVGSACAGPVTWEFTGVVSELEVYQERFNELVEIGSPLHGFVTFDPHTPDARPADPHRGIYYIGDSWSLSFSIGEFHSDHDPYLTDPVLAVTNDYTPVPPGTIPPDTLDLAETVLQFDDMRGIVWISLIDLSGTMLDSDELPAIPPEIHELDLAQFGIASGGFSARATLHTFTAVPEPASGLLLLMGVIALWRRKRHSAT